ncbi:FkbM family methyltransferase [Chryseobacterium gambrini]|uniref:FkbM family methyltransferase n=1 Tax=Chryseobacterium gambrini TaxID=373672 RepID=UPI003BA6175C
MKNTLIENLKKVEFLANCSKWKRFFNNPYKYCTAMIYREFIYAKSKQEKMVEADMFFGRKMKIALPASTDLYLTGGKTHVSEIRLALFLINHLKTDSCFLDIGAHYGYFTLLASELIGENGSILSFEPTEKSFHLLQRNTETIPNVRCFQMAVSDSQEASIFYEFPNLFSEYNTSDIAQFEKEKWFNQSTPKKVEVKTTTLDHIIKSEIINPKIIKVDVEGGEYKVIMGGLNYLKEEAPILVMEYLEPRRKNESHLKALHLLHEIGYQSKIITSEGNLFPVTDVDNYLKNQKLESDNIVFIKETT